MELVKQGPRMVIFPRGSQETLIIARVKKDLVTLYTVDATLREMGFVTVKLGGCFFPSSHGAQGM